MIGGSITLMYWRNPCFIPKMWPLSYVWPPLLYICLKYIYILLFFYFRKSMLELESSPRSKHRNHNDNGHFNGQREAPGKDSSASSSVKSKPTLTSRMDSLLCGHRGWEAPEFQDAVECMGLGPIFHAGSPWFRRMFWIIVVILGWVLGFYQIIQQIQVYFQWPVTSMVDIR